MKLYMKRWLGILLTLSVISCEDAMIPESTSSLNAGDHYSTNSEVYGAFIGLSSAFVKVAEQTVILSELKGDLLQPTLNAPLDVWDIYNFKAGNNTPYSNSKKYYDVVINCNDFLRRLIKYNQDTPGDIPAKVYQGMISQAVNFKAWSLFTIGKFWGEATVYSLNLEDNSEEGMFKLDMAELPQYLIGYMQGGEDGIDAFQPLDWKLVLNNTNANWEGCVMEGRALLGELHLWAGNYQDALDNLQRMVYTSSETNGSLTYHHDVTMGYGGSNWEKLFYTNPSNLAVEVITVAPFNSNYGQVNQLHHYFSNIYPNVYYMAPTDVMVQLFESQVRNNYGRGDTYRGNGVTYIRENGQVVVKKYHLDPDKDQYANDASIHIYRAAGIHLMIAEAYCFMGRIEEALAFLDGGVSAYWGGSQFKAPFTKLPSAFRNNKGIRGRVYLLPLEQKEIFAECIDQRDSIRTMSGLIADEVALELAYEGSRWFTLMRMAGHLGEPSFLAQRVAKKFKEGNSAAEQLLNDPKNWYIKDVKNDILK